MSSNGHAIIHSDAAYEQLKVERDRLEARLKLIEHEIEGWIHASEISLRHAIDTGAMWRISAYQDVLNLLRGLEAGISP